MNLIYFKKALLINTKSLIIGFLSASLTKWLLETPDNPLSFHVLLFVGYIGALIYPLFIFLFTDNRLKHP